jgi:Putative transposase of IS4/5 family (DUF4096)
VQIPCFPQSIQGIPCELTETLLLQLSKLFWLSDTQWAAIEPLLPHLDGKPRVDDCRVISGGTAIARACAAGCVWPRTTVFNRFNRWSQRGLWQVLLAEPAASDDPPKIAMLEAT